jgi:hypothetical protein
MFKNIATFFYQILNLNLGMLKINSWSDPRADGAKRRARVLIPPGLFTPGETTALAKSKVHQISRASLTNGVEWVVILTDLKNMADCL